MNRPLDSTSLLVLTCIRERPDRFAQRLMEFLADPESQWFTERGQLDLARIYVGRPPRGGHELRAVIWQPHSLHDWTAFYVNSEDGRSHLFAKLSQAGGSPETLSIRSTSPAADGQVQEFIYRVASSNTYEPTRLLQWLEEEDGFRFIDRGEPLPFERGAARSGNPIKTREDLLTFVGDFGLDLRDEDFWKSNEKAIYLIEKWLT